MALKQPKLLLVTRNFPPLTGGMEKLIYHGFLALKEVYNVSIIGPAGFEPFAHGAEQRIPLVYSPLSRFLLVCLLKTWKAAKIIRPAVILCGSGLTAPAAVLAGKFFHIPVVCYLHGLDIIADHALYQTLFVPFIKRADRIIVNSRHTAQLASQAGIRQDKISLIHPGVNIPFPANHAHLPQAVCAIDPSRPLILSVGRLTPRKGLVEFIENCLPSIRSAFPDVLLWIIGEDAKNAVKNSGSVKERIMRLVQRGNLERNVLLMGHVDEETLSHAYRTSDLFIFPARSLPGDVEGFGLVALEAAAHGLPTVAFASGGIPDAVSHGQSGFLVAPENYPRLTKTVIHVLKQKDPVINRDTCIAFARNFSWECFGDKLRQVCREVS